MLILRRKVGEKIVIGEGITVVVSRVSGGRVTLGIEAPSDVHIVRGELQPLDTSSATPAPVRSQSIEMPLVTGPAVYAPG